MSSPQQHSALGASSAHRWMLCPGSVRMSENIDDSAERSPYAAEGTLAHTWAEAVLSDASAPIIGDIPQEMPEYVKIYTQLIEEFIKLCDWHEIEHMFSLAELDPPVEAYGTADFVGYRASDRSLIVADLKYGTGVVVEAEDNVQLKYYAVGALLSYQAMGNTAPVDKVRLIIVQPRAYHPDGAVREAVIDIQDLMEFSIDLIDAMHETQKPDAKLVTGTHCRWCRAAAICPALLEKNQEIAATDFADPDTGGIATDPRALSHEHVGQMLGQLDSIEHWINSVRMYAQNELERGREIPGWKLVAKQARRQWANDGAVLTWAQEKNLPIFEKPKLKSPAQVEKTLPKGQKLPDDLTVKQSSGNKIARADSPLPEVTTGSEFFE